MTIAPLHNAQRSRRAFTLVELLVVVALIVMLVALSALAIDKMSGERKLATAGAMTADLINHARQLSRATNTLTMVALATGGADAGRALTTLSYSGTSTTNGGWTQIDQWRRLPDGVMIDQTTPVDTYLFKTPPSSDIKLSRSGTNVTFSAAVFLPDGRPLTSATVPQLLYVRPSTTGTSGPNYYKIIVNQATGVPITRRP